MRRKKKRRQRPSCGRRPPDRHVRGDLRVIFARALTTVVFVFVVDWRAFGGGGSGAGIRERRPIGTSAGGDGWERDLDLDLD